MDIADYLVGRSSSAVVRDLIGARGQDVEVLFLVESPHSDELDRRHPLAGITGRDALAVLESRKRDSVSLGQVVKQMIDAGDGRLAIVNVSTVPLQAEAFTSSKRVPTSPPIDWKPLVELREHAQDPVLPWSKQAERAYKVLLDDVQRRIAAVQLGPGALIVGLPFAGSVRDRRPLPSLRARTHSRVRQTRLLIVRCVRASRRVRPHDAREPGHSPPAAGRGREHRCQPTGSVERGRQHRPTRR